MRAIIPTDRLFEGAARAGVEVGFYDFAAPVLGLYADTPDGPVIGLHKHLLQHERLLRCVLAEELGHHFASGGCHIATPHQSYAGRVMLGREERRALAWAARVLVPQLGFVREVRGGAGVEDLAEAFYVTPTFIRAVTLLPGYAAVLARARAGGRRREA